jgi:adenosylcobinamide-GDP ribazoletransferase
VNNMLRGLVTAIRTLSVLPIPGKEAEKPSSALPWFPVVGLLLGCILWIAAELFDVIVPGYWPEGAAVVLILLGTVLTGGLHLDGLSDSVDGFSASRDRDTILRIMKDSHVGAFGVVALITALLAKYVCFVRLIDTGSVAWVIAALIVSRTVQADLAVRQDYARAEGGTAATFVRDAEAKHAVVAIILALVLLVVVCGWNWLVLAVLFLGWGVGRWFGVYCRRRVDGVTGDLLGAGSEIVEVFVLIVCAALR